MFFDIYSELCSNVGKSPSSVAVALGISKASMSDWKNKGSYPNAKNLSAIADYFGVTVDYLLGKEKTATPEGDGLDGDKAELIRWVKSMTPEEAAEFRRLWNAWKASR